VIRTPERPVCSLVAVPTTQYSRQVKYHGMGQEYGIHGGGWSEKYAEALTWRKETDLLGNLVADGMILK